MTISILTQPCRVCGKTSLVYADPIDAARWLLGEHVQKVWPHWSADERELLISGTHSECWAQLFPEGDDE